MPVQVLTQVESDSHSIFGAGALSASPQTPLHVSQHEEPSSTIGRFGSEDFRWISATSRKTRAFGQRRRGRNNWPRARFILCDALRERNVGPVFPYDYNGLAICADASPKDKSGSPSGCCRAGGAAPTPESVAGLGW